MKKWNDKWVIMVRKWMKDMSISDEKMDNSRAQHLPQTEVVVKTYNEKHSHKLEICPKQQLNLT